MALHVPTLLLTSGVVCALIALVQLAISYRLRIPALGYWAASNITGAAGTLLLAMRSELPPEATILFGNGLIFIWLALALSGMRVFDGKPPMITWTLTGAFAGAFVLFAAYRIEDNLGQRVIIASLLIAGWCALGASVMFCQPLGDIRSRARGLFAMLLAVFSVLYVARAIGVAAHWSTPTTAFAGPLQGLVVLISLAVATSWNFCSLYMVLDRLASRDDLTGLLNRRTILLQGRVMFEEAHAQRRAISVLMLDLDHFKTINDRFGHQVGDAVLQRFAEVASQGVRARDLIGRVGGEEFCVILPGADATAAQEVGERLRLLAERELASVAHCPTGGTVTIGVATLSPDQYDQISITALLKEADEALYFAKAQGRNRVLSANLLAGRGGRTPLPAPGLHAASASA